jgi:hypothetical protein
MRGDGSVAVGCWLLAVGSWELVQTPVGKPFLIFDTLVVGVPFGRRLAVI